MKKSLLIKSLVAVMQASQGKNMTNSPATVGAPDLDKLEALAKAAEQMFTGMHWYTRFQILDGISNDESAAFIVALDPATVLELIALARARLPAAAPVGVVGLGPYPGAWSNHANLSGEGGLRTAAAPAAPVERESQAEAVAWRYRAFSPFQQDAEGNAVQSDRWSLVHSRAQMDSFSSSCGAVMEPLYAVPAAPAERESHAEALSMEPEARMLRTGRHLFEVAKRNGWPDDGEGAYEFVQRLSYTQGKEDAAKGTTPAAPSDGWQKAHRAQQGEPVALQRYNIDCRGLPFADPAGVWVAYGEFAAIKEAAPADAAIHEPSWQNGYARGYHDGLGDARAPASSTTPKQRLQNPIK